MAYTVTKASKWTVTKREPSAYQRVGNAFIRGTAAGVAGLAGLPVDTSENIINLGLAGAGSLANLAGRPDFAPDLLQGSFGGSEYLRSRMADLGIESTNPNLNDWASRATFAGGRVIGSGPGRGTIPSALGASAGAAIDPSLEAVGSMTPATIRGGARAAKEALIPPGTQTANAFRSAGVEPSAGQATGSTFIQGLENFLSRMPGGAGPLRKFITEQQAKVGAGVITGSAEQAGRTIERGVTGFMDRTRKTWLVLDNALGEKLTPETQVNPSQTLATLDSLTTPIKGAEKTSEALRTTKMFEVRRGVESDLAGTPGKKFDILGPDGQPISTIELGGVPGKETLPAQALRQLRSRVGALLDDSLVSGIPNGELKSLYGSLSKDLEAAAKAKGPETYSAWKRQNDYYSARQERIEGALQKVLGKDRMPEDIFAATSPKNAEQVNLLRQVMRSLKTDEREVVTRAVIGRLGKASPGRQSDVGDVFSTDQFLTNWNKISKQAKVQLFPDIQQRAHLEIVAKTAAKIKEAGSVGQNYSNTAGNIAQYTLYGGAALGAATGNIPVVATAAGGLAASNLTARLLTNPKFVQWLAQSTRVKPEQAAAHMKRLAVIYNTSDEETRKDLEKYSQSLGNKKQ